MKNILITSKCFGGQLDIGHKQQLIKYFEENGCRLIWNAADHGMSAKDIITANAKHLIDAIVVYSSSDEINQEVFEQCRNLKVVARHGVGIENIDVVAAEKNGVAIRTTAQSMGYETVADLTFALMLSLARKVTVIDAQLRKNIWYRPISNDVWGKTLGIIGLGRIGKAVVRRAKGFGMNILVYTRNPDLKYFVENGITLCSKEEVIAKADFLTLHCDINEETRGMIGEQELSLMKPTAYLINTARSGLINQRALIEALKSKKIAGAAIDVFDIEPIIDDALINENLESVVATSHVGSYTFDLIRQMDFLVAENIVQAV